MQIARWALNCLTPSSEDESGNVTKELRILLTTTHVYELPAGFLIHGQLPEGMGSGGPQ